MSKAPDLIVFTDLDGTLLDHENYSYAAAAPAITALKERGYPLILASSKTASEIGFLRDELGFSYCPAIVENGSGILGPGPADTDQTSDEEYHKIIHILNAAPLTLRQFYTGFSDWSVQEIADRTGLPETSAAKAANRQFSEPGLWTGTPEDKRLFITYLNEHGISARSGGRFMTLSFGATKGQRVTQIIDTYTQNGKRPFSLALGDAPNDVEMLEAADKAVIIYNPHGADIPPLAGESTGKIIRSTQQSPLGWNTAVLDMIAQIDLQNENTTGN